MVLKVDRGHSRHIQKMRPFAPCFGLDRLEIDIGLFVSASSSMSRTANVVQPELVEWAVVVPHLDVQKFISHGPLER